jgi:hypothetical protein
MDGSNPLNEFILAAAKQGETAEQISQQLIQAGWDKDAVARAISILIPTSNPSQIYSPPKVDYISNPDFNQKDSHSVHKKFNTKLIVSALFFLLFVSSGTVYYFVAQKNSREQTYVTEPTLTKSAQQSDQENGYITYTNLEYKFLFHMPNNWSSKEYSIGAFGSEKRIAFGEIEKLPSMFFNSGDYAWIKIYPLTDQKLYSEYQFLKSQVGQGTVKEGFLGGQVGIDTGTNVAVEKNGMIYEFNLPSTQDSNLNLQFTDVSQEIITSFTFVE